MRLPHRLSSQPPAQTPPHLLHRDADAHGVNRALDEDLLLLVPADDHRLQQQLFAAPANRGRAGVTQKEAFTGGKQGKAAVRITGMWGLCYRMFPSRRCSSSGQTLPRSQVRPVSSSPQLPVSLPAPTLCLRAIGCPKRGRNGPAAPKAGSQGSAVLPWCPLHPRT